MSAELTARRRIIPGMKLLAGAGTLAGALAVGAGTVSLLPVVVAVGAAAQGLISLASP